jgi:hypothetical protein
VQQRHKDLQEFQMLDLLVMIAGIAVSHTLEE